MQIESVAPSFRSITPLFSVFVWVGGYILVGVLHLFFLNWRYLYLIISTPGLLTFIFYWYFFVLKKINSQNIKVLSRIASLVNYK